MTAHEPVPDSDAVAVIGLSLRLPEADTLAQFRDNLRSGRDSVRALPERRMTDTGLRSDTGHAPMGYQEDITSFDHGFFGMSRREAELLDPQHRLALTLAHEAVEGAGYAPSKLRGSDTATIFSLPSPEYQHLVRDSSTLSAIGNIPAGLPSRVAHTLGLLGPCYGVDTGCNSALVATHHARRELLSGDASYALVGSVSLRVWPPTASDATQYSELVSRAGRCRAFDADADGTVGGEGGVVLLLTTLSRALADGATVHAVLRGTAVSHNGHRSSTISSPSAAAQSEVIRRAWARAGVDPATAGYLEAHGSGTRLGDAIEVEGLAGVFANRPAHLPIGSVKTNIGHLDHAAGAAGMVKAILSVRHGELYPSLHFTRPATGVDLDAAGIRVVTETAPWPSTDLPRRAGVSSFSLGGANAHLVVEQPPPPPAPTALPSTDPPLIGVSARTADDLAELCARLAHQLRAGDVPLRDIAFTLNQGRDHYDHRVALVARDTEELAVRLAAQATWLRGDDRAPRQPAPGPPPRVALLLSPDARVPTTPDGGALPATGIHGTAGADGPPDSLPFSEPAAATARWQLKAHRALLQAGVTFVTLLSTGLARYTARFLLGTLTEDDTRALRERRPAADLDPDRLVEAAHTLLADGPVIFVETGTRGVLADHLEHRLADRPDATVLTSTDEPNGLTRLLGRLYELGVDLDWAALGEPLRPARRVPLPTHPLSGPRCWVLAPGELIAGPGTTRARAGHGLAGTATPGPPPRQPSAPADPTSPDHAAAQPGGDTASHHRPARTTTLDWLRGTLTALLHADGVSAEDDYFALGGNSIIAVQLVDLVAERYGVRPKLVEIYQHPRVGDFARYLDEALPTPDPGPHHCRHDPAPPPPPAAATPAGGTDRRGLPRLPPVEPGDELVLSFGQERMWFHHQLDPNTTLYNLPTTGRVRGELDIDALRQTWEDLAQRHEVLRSNFVESADGPVLVLRPMLGDFLHVVDVSGTADPVAAARPVVRAAADHVFDLAKDPLVRVLIVRLGEEDHVVQTTMHHAVNDGASPGIFRAEVNDFYRARRAGREHRFPPLPVQYRDYARWQRKLDADGLLDHELDYWRATLRGAPRLDLPLDHPRPASRDYSGAISPFTVPPDVAQRLRALARRESVTLFVVLLAAWYLLLARLSRQRDITVGTPTAGRGRPELWGLVGFFNGTVALRADLSDGPALPELLTRVRDIVLGALEHQEIPFDRVVNDLGGARDLSRNPLFDVFFIHQEQPAIQPIGDSPVEFFDERTVENLFGGLPPGTSKFDLTLVTSDREGEDTISGCLEYSTELFDGGTIAGWAVAYQQLLAGLAAAVDAHDPFGTLSKLLPAGSPGGRTPNAGQPATAALDAWTRVLRDRSANIQRRLSRTPGTRPPADPVPVVERHERRVPADVVRRARDLHPDDEDLFLTVLAASQVALARRHDQRDVLVGVAGADTSAPAPVRLRVHDDHTFRELVGRTTVAVEGVTGGTVRADLLADRLDLAVNSLPDLFDLRHQRLHRDGPPPRVGLDGLTLSSGVTTGGELVLLVERCGGSTGHDRAKALADDLADLLPALVREPGQPLRDHPLPDHRTRPGSR